jgi:hypothetical protein
VVYTVGSRWAIVHVGLKNAVKGSGAVTIEELARPPTAAWFETLAVDAGMNQGKELGWVDEAFHPRLVRECLFVGCPACTTSSAARATKRRWLRAQHWHGWVTTRSTWLNFERPKRFLELPWGLDATNGPLLSAPDLEAGALSCFEETSTKRLKRQ